MRPLQFVNKLLAGLVIGALSWLSAQHLPAYGWLFGWLGCWLYFVLVVSR